MSSSSALSLSKYSWTESVLPVYPSGIFGKTCKVITEPPPRRAVHAPTIKEFTLRQLPQVMRRVLRWPVSAAVMERWLSLPAREFTDGEKRGDIKPKDIPRHLIDTGLITWTWLNKFERVQKAEATLAACLSTSNAIEELSNRVKRNKDIYAKLLGKTPLDIHNDPQSPTNLHSHWQFQFVEVGYQMGQIDDLYGALGNFMLCAAVTKAKLTIVREGLALLAIREVGIYARDTFEFNGQQYLGHWSDKGLALQPMAMASNLTNRIPTDMPSWHLPAWHPRMGWLKPVNNSDFRTLRNNTQRGGDFLLFSDVKLKPVQLDVEVTF